MINRESSYCRASRRIVFYYYSCKIIIFSKYFIHKKTKLSIFIIIYCYNNYSRIFQKFTSNNYSSSYPAYPFTMFIAIFAVNKVIIIFPVSSTCVVRRIDVDNINLSLMGIAEGSECFKVVTLNQYMVGSIRLIAQYRLVLHFAKHGEFFS